MFCIFPVHGKNSPIWPQIGPGGVFPTNPDLADILGRRDLNFENLYFFDFLDTTFLDFQVPRSPIFWISRSPDLQIPRFPDFQVPRFPDAGGGAGRILRSQPDPSPNAPRDQIRRKGPCCEMFGHLAFCWAAYSHCAGTRLHTFYTHSAASPCCEQ